jgi:hypothetical protein
MSALIIRDTLAYTTTADVQDDDVAVVLTKISRLTRSAGTGNVPSRNQR